LTLENFWKITLSLKTKIQPLKVKNLLLLLLPEILIRLYLHKTRKKNKDERNKKQAKKKDKTKKVKRIKNRENKIIKNINHKISKALIQRCLKDNSGIVLENIKSIRKTAKSRKKQRYFLNSWSFYQLQMMIEYKAKKLGIPVFYVEPQYTSQRCSDCGHMKNLIDKENFSHVINVEKLRMLM